MCVCVCVFGAWATHGTSLWSDDRENKEREGKGEKSISFGSCQKKWLLAHYHVIGRDVLLLFWLSAVTLENWLRHDIEPSSSSYSHPPPPSHPTLVSVFSVPFFSVGCGRGRERERERVCLWCVCHGYNNNNRRTGEGGRRERTTPIDGSYIYVCIYIWNRASEWVSEPEQYCGLDHSTVGHARL